MTWRVVLTGAIALSLAIIIGILAIVIRREYPLLCAVTVAAELGVIVSGLKAVLDTTKTANELRKMAFEVEKLKLEIGEKKKAAEKEDARIVVATFEQIETYGRPRRASSKGVFIYGGTASLLVIVLCGLVFVINRPAAPPMIISSISPPLIKEGSPDVSSPPSNSLDDNRTKPPRTPARDQPSRGASEPTVSSLLPPGSPLLPSQPSLQQKDKLYEPTPEQKDKLEPQIDDLKARAASVNSSLNYMQRSMALDGLSLRADIVAKQASMNLNLGKAEHALNANDADSASRFVALAKVDLKALETFLGR